MTDVISKIALCCKNSSLVEMQVWNFACNSLTFSFYFGLFYKKCINLGSENQNYKLSVVIFITCDITS